MIKEPKDLDSKALHENIVTLSTILELFTHGQYPGQASMNVVNAINYVNPIRNVYIEEFISRPDAEEIAPEAYAEAQKWRAEQEKANV